MAIKGIERVVVFVCGILIGAVVCSYFVNGLQMRAGKAGLQNYAEHLLTSATQLTEEADQAVTAVNQADLPFCSDQELAFMRDYVFKSEHIKDIGRTSSVDDNLYCTTGIGRLPVPMNKMAPDLTINGMNIGVNRVLLITKTPTAVVLRKQDVSVILNPASYNGLDEPPKFYAGYFYDQQNSRVFHAMGHAIPLTGGQVLAQKPIESQGVLYWPLCSQDAGICVVAAESQANIMAAGRSVFEGYVVGGGLLGGATALILILFYKRQRSVELQLRRAIRRGDLTLVYQPIVDLQTRAIVGAEALVRWKNQAGESIRPDVFVALAEEKGFVREITQLVLRKSLIEVRDLMATDTFRLTINITSEDLNDPAFFELLAQSMHMTGVKPSALGLELTEHSAADPSTAAPAIRKLKLAGHMIYIDDFGTGYSSLAYLHNLKADVIKIDRSFTQTVGTQSITASIVPQILNIASEMEMLVVVEGIETGEQAEYFRKAKPGILGQGWLFSKAVPASELKTMVRSGFIACETAS